MQVKKKNPCFPVHVCLYSKRKVLNRYILGQNLKNHSCKSIIFVPITKRTSLLLSFACIYRKNKKSILVWFFFFIFSRILVIYLIILQKNKILGRGWALTWESLQDMQDNIQNEPVPIRQLNVNWKVLKCDWMTKLCHAITFP